jgi:hypothetical protein
MRVQYKRPFLLVQFYVLCTISNVSSTECPANTATVLGSIPASSDMVTAKRRQMKQCCLKYIYLKHPAIFLIMFTLANKKFCIVSVALSKAMM